jgi:hypothetical protein
MATSDCGVVVAVELPADDEVDKAATPESTDVATDADGVG